jgi:hypothetical protein
MPHLSRLALVAASALLLIRLLRHPVHVHPAG